MTWDENLMKEIVEGLVDLVLLVVDLVLLLVAPVLFLLTLRQIKVVLGLVVIIVNNL
jgi:hypothetical protein